MKAVYKNIIKNNHVGYNEFANYDELILKYPIYSEDLDYFEQVIDKSTSSQSDYDGFPDDGGIDIAAILLAEVKRLRSLNL